MVNQDVPQSEMGRGAINLPDDSPSNGHDPINTPSVLKDLLGEEWPGYSPQERMVTKTFAVDQMIYRMLHAVYFDRCFSGEVRSMSELLRSIVKFPLEPDIGMHTVHAGLANRHRLYGRRTLSVSIPGSWLDSFTQDALNFFNIQYRRLSHAKILELRVIQWIASASVDNQLPPDAMKILKEPPPQRGLASSPYLAVNGISNKSSLSG